MGTWELPVSKAIVKSKYSPKSKSRYVYIFISHLQSYV